MSSTTERESASSADIPPEQAQPRRSETERSAAQHGTARNEHWKKKNLLSFDGGGIRGFWTLLVLQLLVKYIYAEEISQAHAAGERRDEFHSFWPAKYPRNVSQCRNAAQREERHEEDDGPRDVPGSDTKAILLCHYFDLICGTSTGSLIAIMLGRFRMTIDDCLEEYERMSQRIFGKPRLISQRNTGMPWPKYNARGMEDALQEVSLRRCEQPVGKYCSVTPMFPMKTDATCQTFVTTFRRTKNLVGVDSEDFYLIRSYTHEKDANLVTARQQQQDPHFETSVTPSVNHGPAEQMEIPQVGRAATAAPLYFKELKVRQKHGTKGQKYYFSDAGFGELNNPTGLGLQEIETLFPRQTVGAILNVGTSRNKPDPSGRSVLHIVKRIADKANNPSIVANEMLRRGLNHYWRFNDDRGIKVELDDWKPNSRFSKGIPGSETRRIIQGSVDWWAGQPQNIRYLQDCARELVTTRRGRCQDESRWEQFAIGAHDYRCQHGDCRSESFNSRHQFRLHWELQHEGEAYGEDYEQPKFKRWVYQKRPEDLK